MDQDDAAHVRSIRAAIQAERKLIADLDSKVKAPGLKVYLEQAASLLDFAEFGVLDPKLLQEPRSKAALSSWIGNAEKFLRYGIDQRGYVDEVLKTYGPDVRAFP